MVTTNITKNHVDSEYFEVYNRMKSQYLRSTILRSGQKKNST